MLATWLLMSSYCVPTYTQYILRTASQFIFTFYHVQNASLQCRYQHSSVLGLASALSTHPSSTKTRQTSGATAAGNRESSEDAARVAVGQPTRFKPSRSGTSQSVSCTLQPHPTGKRYMLSRCVTHLSLIQQFSNYYAITCMCYDIYRWRVPPTLNWDVILV